MKHLMLIILITIAAAGMAVSAEQTTHVQETRVFSGGNILTVDAKFSVADAMAIRGSTILAVGNKADVLAVVGKGSIHKHIDLKGKTVLPGFIDAHNHMIASSALSLFKKVGLAQYRNVDDALVYMKKQAAGATAQDWLLFINIDLSTQAFSEPALTTKHLNAISSLAPVVVWHAGGHKMTVNSAMLNLMGVTDDTPNPTGSEFTRYKDGSPDGNILGAGALFKALAVIEPFTKFNKSEGVQKLHADWVARGLTTVGLPGVQSPSDWKVATRLAASPNFNIRTRAYLLWTLLDQWDKAEIKPGDGNNMARAIGWKISVDGSNQAFTGLQREHYLNREDHGLEYMKLSDMESAVIEGTNRGGQIMMHGNGDAAIDNIIAAVSKSRQKNTKPIRPRIEHCSIVQDDQIEKLIENNITCSFLIGHVLLWGQAFRDNVFGLEKAQKLDRTGSFEKAGIAYSLHTDFGVTDLSPLEMVEVAVTRTLFAEPDYVLAPEERASIEGAIRGITSAAAWQLMSESEIGSLEAGKLADFVLLAKDPRKVAPKAIGEIEVLQTWIDGKRIH